MAETIPGGATLASDGKTWRNANGEELNAAQVKEVKRLHAELADQKQAAEEQRRAIEIAQNPTAQALAQALMPKGDQAVTPRAAARTSSKTGKPAPKQDGDGDGGDGQPEA